MPEYLAFFNCAIVPAYLTFLTCTIPYFFPEPGVLAYHTFMLGLFPYTVSIQKRTRRELEGGTGGEGEVENDAQGGGSGGGGGCQEP